jgi:PhnB protein
LIEFVKTAFDATDIERITRPDGSVMHAQVTIGSSMLMMGGATAEWLAMPAGLNLYVDDADATHARALAAGAPSVMPLTDEFWGDRMGGVRDTSGTCWWIATHVEDVPPAEMARRAGKPMAAGM